MRSNGFDAFDMLRRDHAECIHRIAMLETASDSIRLHGFSAHEFGNIVEAVEYIDSQLRNHHGLEERHLFPFLERHAPERLAKLREEHRQLWSTFGKLLRSVRDIQDGRIYGTSIIELTSTSNIMAKLLHSHINDEETVLFPLVKGFLTEKEYESLSNEIERSSRHNQ